MIEDIKKKKEELVKKILRLIDLEYKRIARFRNLRIIKISKNKKEEFEIEIETRLGGFNFLDLYDSIKYLQQHKYCCDFFEDSGDITYMYFIFYPDSFNIQRILTKLYYIQEDYQLDIKYKLEKMQEILENE
ncbi:MAG: hypothetical protein ACTSQP_22370 [Promethearchaeota archaeon]